MTDYTNLIKDLRYDSGEGVQTLGAIMCGAADAIEKLLAERDQWKNDALNGGNAAFLRDALAKCKAENERLKVERDTNKRMRDLHFAERDALRLKLEEMRRQEPLTDTYVQPVPDKCDRIVWKSRYYHLPIEDPKALKPLTDHSVNLMAHNDDNGDWNDLRSRDCWHDGYRAGVRAAETEHGIGSQQ